MPNRRWREKLQTYLIWIVAACDLRDERSRGRLISVTGRLKPWRVIWERVRDLNRRI